MSKKYTSLFIILFLCISCSENRSLTNVDTEKKSIDSLLVSENISEPHKMESLHKLLNLVDSDSLANAYTFTISYHYLEKKDSLPFRYWHRITEKQALKLKDTSRIAEAYWDLGRFYQEQGLMDSSFINYNQSYNHYILIGNKKYAGKLLILISVIQKNVGDFTGSEITAFKGIALLKPMNEYGSLYALYNTLGIVNNELKEYEKALIHHEKALMYGEKMEDLGTRKIISLNNIGVVKQNMGLQDEAIAIFEEALTTEGLFSSNAKLYAMLIDNKAYSSFLQKDTLGIEKQYNKALKIRDSIKHMDGVVMNKIHLSEFYIFKNDTLSAIKYAKEANALAKNTRNHRDILASYLLLSKIDEENSKKYLTNYIRINDSLHKQERIISNKFTKIQFETDEFIAENEKLTERQGLLLSLSGTFAIFALLIFVILTQRFKNKKLWLIHQEKAANEKITSLLLDQQTIQEESRERERKKISEELHDGILAKFFGISLSLESLNSRVDPEALLTRENYLNYLKEIGKELREVSHNLNSPYTSAAIGFQQLLEDIIKKESDIINYQFEVDDRIEWEKITGNLKMNIYDLMQDYIRNFIKYAKASNIEVVFTLENELLQISLKNDGLSLGSNKNLATGSKKIKSSIKAIRGEFLINSKAKTGTELIIKVPVKL